MATTRRRSLILVTGAPRSGTTPVGATLALAPGACSIYEPWGGTGDVRFQTTFPIPGTGGLTHRDVVEFLDDLAALRLRLKPQKRPVHETFSLVRRTVLRLTGTRTLHSLRLARANPFCKHIIWKDPIAVFGVPDVLECGVPVVAILRPALAHAASYKRLNWRPKLAAIYPRFAERYGADAQVEALIRRHSRGPVVEAAGLWRMVYSVIQQVVGRPGLHIVDAQVLADDEVTYYERLFGDLGLDFAKARKHVARRVARAQSQNRDAVAVHDWARSVQHTNSYWRATLSPEEVSDVKSLTIDVEMALKESLHRLHVSRRQQE